jgi:hypothetical protein
MIGLDGEKMTLTNVTNVGQSIKFDHITECNNLVV